MRRLSQFLFVCPTKPPKLSMPWRRRLIGRERMWCVGHSKRTSRITRIIRSPWIVSAIRTILLSLPPPFELGLQRGSSSSSGSKAREQIELIAALE